MSDDIFFGLLTGPNDHETRSLAERKDMAFLQTELEEQRRIGAEQVDVFGHNRVLLERKPG